VGYTRLGSRAEAVRELLRVGLAAHRDRMNPSATIDLTWVSNTAQTAREHLSIMPPQCKCSTVRAANVVMSSEALMLTYKLNGHNKPLPMTEADSRVSQFMNCSMALVDLFQRDMN